MLDWIERSWKSIRRSWERRSDSIRVQLVRYSKSKLKPAIDAAIIGLPPLLLAYVNLKVLGTLPLQSQMSDLFFRLQWLPLVLLAWPLLCGIFTALVSDWLRRMAEDDGVDHLTLVALMTALNDIKGKKLHRFATFARRVKDDKALASKTFVSITQPGQQIEYIMIKMHHVLTVALGDPGLKLVLAKMENGVPAQWRCHMPNDVLLPERFLRDDAPGTLFAACARANKYQLIPDIEEHLGKKRDQLYIPIGNEEDRGSIVCLPIASQELERVMYVLSIKSDAPDRLNKHVYKRQSPIINAFLIRIGVEAHLEMLREWAGGGNGQDHGS